jgi:hypothetical protein
MLAYQSEGQAGEEDCIESSPKIQTLSGAVCAVKKRCGHANCRCKRGEEPHGPYFYRYWREGGRRRKRYVKKADVSVAIAACLEHRRQRELARKIQSQSMQQWRNFTVWLRSLQS